ncbi:MAG: AI-2E family transporter [Ruminococcaceae bacterium]|nr:AI-2E family transporter [Oscillospiraceae bacterium]
MPEKPENKKWYDRIKFYKFKITPMRIYLFIVAVFLAVKVIFDVKGFGDFVSNLISFVLSVFSYLIIGAILAFVLNSYADVWEKKILKKMKSQKAKRNISIIIAYVTLVLFVTLILFALVPALVDTVKTFADNIPKAFATIKEVYVDITQNGRFNLSEDVLAQISKGLTNLQEIATKIFSPQKITAVFSGTISGLFNVIMGIMISVYMLIEKDSVMQAMKKINYAIFPGKRANTIQWGASRINLILRQYISGKLLQALIILVVSYLLFLICGIKYAILLAVIMAIMNMIPYIGPWIGGAIVVFISIPQGLYTIVASLVCVLAVQALDNWFVGPKIIGGKMGASPLLVLVGLCVCGGIFGLPGMILGDVMAVIFKVFFYDRFVENKLKGKAEKGLLPKDFVTENALQTEPEDKENGK